MNLLINQDPFLPIYLFLGDTTVCQVFDGFLVTAFKITAFIRKCCRARLGPVERFKSVTTRSLFVAQLAQLVSSQ